jgi:GNAT superfamily N-acetyltransferase
MDWTIKVFKTDSLCEFFREDNYEDYVKRLNDHKNNLDYFHLDSGIWFRGEEFFVCVVDGEHGEMDGEKILGVFNYVVPQQVTLDAHLHYISYISVRPEYQNKGIAKALIQFWLQNVYRPDLGELGCSGYTQKGFDYLKPKLESLGIPIQIRKKEF